MPFLRFARGTAAALLACLIAGCGARDVINTPGPVPVGVDWRQVATEADRERLRNWRKAWIAGFDMARKAGKGDAIDAEGLLFDPDRVIDGSVPPPGDYRCRVFKFGAKGTAMEDYITYPVAKCRVELDGAVSRFAKLDGAQRPNGMIFHDSGSRAVFLGSMMLGDETRVIDYGLDKKRDMIGYVDHIAPAQWRMVLPSPGFESMIDVIELVPAGS
jgi:hypothetical protein